jgi:hypothetical protein
MEGKGEYIQEPVGATRNKEKTKDMLYVRLLPTRQPKKYTNFVLIPLSYSIFFPYFSPDQAPVSSQIGHAEFFR